jgi:hypothetical protein
LTVGPKDVHDAELIATHRGKAQIGGFRAIGSRPTESRDMSWMREVVRISTETGAATRAVPSSFTSEDANAVP